MRILIVEDEQALGRLLARVLREEGNVVRVASDGTTGFALAAGEAFDVLVLDWMLPERSGLQIVSGLRAAGIATPVLMLTARDQVEDQVEGLEAGADDYLAKPFALAVLLARLRALTRRAPAERGEPLVTVGELTLDPLRHAVRRGGETIDLTAKEFALMHALMRRPGQVFTRSVLLDAVWNAPGDLRTNVVELYISYLRRKLDLPGRPSLIRTVRGVGYTLESPGTR